MKRQKDDAPKKIKLSNLWEDDIDEQAEWLRGKREDTAITLNGMLHESKISRAELARILKWKPSRVTRALSGEENLTINTLAEIIGAAKLDFDILIRPRMAVRALQPWEEREIKSEVIATSNQAKSHYQIAIVVMLKTTNELTRAALRMAVPQAAKSSEVYTSRYAEEQNAPVACKA